MQPPIVDVGIRHPGLHRKVCIEVVPPILQVFICRTVSADGQLKHGRHRIQHLGAGGEHVTLLRHGVLVRIDALS